MIEAPFSGAEAASALAALAAAFLALGGIGLILRARTFAARAVGLGAVVGVLAGLSTGLFQ
jgi:hypothetical protein